MKKIVIAGGTGFLGSCLQEYYSGTDSHLVVLTRGKPRDERNIRYVRWDGKNQGSWRRELEGADLLLNLNGKSVDCRYNDKNRALIYSTRIDATRALGEAVLACQHPPKCWINASSATIYRHSTDKEMDEYSGEIGTGFSVDVVRKWEDTFNRFVTPSTRKVIIRTAIVLGRNGGALQPLKTLAQVGLGGQQGPGNQYISWLHAEDFVSIIDFISSHHEVEGVYNLAAPHPIRNKDFMAALRRAVNMPGGMPIPQWLLSAGAAMIRTETELVLKSRRVVPKKLTEAGYKFKFGSIGPALYDLCNRPAPAIASITNSSLSQTTVHHE